MKPAFHHPFKKEELVKDPVCGMTLACRHARAHLLHHGKVYYFCSNSCKEKFEWWPARYVKEEEKESLGTG